MIDLNAAAKTAYKTSLKRAENGAFGSNNDVLKHAAGEIVEAINARFRFLESKRCAFSYRLEKDTAEYTEELADVIICALIQAGEDGLDIEQAVIDKMEKNRLRAEKQGDKL